MTTIARYNQVLAVLEADGLDTHRFAPEWGEQVAQLAGRDVRESAYVVLDEPVASVEVAGGRLVLERHLGCACGVWEAIKAKAAPHLAAGDVVVDNYFAGAC